LAADTTPNEEAASRRAPFSSATPSSDLKNSRCAEPTQVTTPTSGAAMSHSAAISPGWLEPISSTRNSASSGQLSIVSGRPMWLLKLPSVAYVRPTVERNALRSSLVVVLPAEPVTPTTFALSDMRLWRAFS